MNRAFFVCLCHLVTATFLLSQSNSVPLINQTASVVAPIIAAPVDPKAQGRILDNYGRLPLTFEANEGQTDGRVKFLSRTTGFMLFLTRNEAVMALSGKRRSSSESKIAGTVHPVPSGVAVPKTGGVLRMKLLNSNSEAKVTGVDELAGSNNYFIGNDPAKWRTNVPTYAKVKYEGIYSGIDLVYYGNERQLEYDFIVAPGADPHHIRFDINGARRIRRDGNGDLVIKMGEGEIRWHEPIVYQEKKGVRQLVSARYALTDANRVGFELGKYDPHRMLYVDPLIYSTFLGGSGSDYGAGLAVDASGDIYVTGSTQSTDFPTTDPLQPTNHGLSNAFVAKLNPTGTALIYSTYLGGSGNDEGCSLVIDSAGNAYVTGSTQSTDFPVTSGAFQTTYGGDTDAFVTKLNPTGSALVYSAYLGGTGVDGHDGEGNGIAVDSAGDAFITGFTESTDFPVTPGAFQTTSGALIGGAGDAFVTEINPTGSALVYSTYLGSNGNTAGNGIVVDSMGDAYVTGTTGSTTFPVTPGAFQTTHAGGFYDAFVSEINPRGSALVYSSYLGGSGLDLGYGVAVDNTGNAYVTGATQSMDFPVTPGAFQTICKGGNSCAEYGEAFVTKINPAGSALGYSTYLGGRRGESGLAVAVDVSGSAYVTGLTRSTDFPITPGAFQTVCKGCDKSNAFVSKLNPTGSALVYSTYLGGSQGNSGDALAVDSLGGIYVGGVTYSIDFPITPDAFQTVCNGSSGCATYGDAFITKLYMPAATTTTLSSSLNPSTYGQPVTFPVGITSKLGTPPDGETVSFMKGTAVLGTRTLVSGSASFTTSTLKAGVNAITAGYSGDPNFASNKSKTVKQAVNKATTAVDLASLLNPSIVGQSVTLTARVTPEFSGNVTGTVAFYDGTTLLKTSTLSAGVAKLTTSKLTSGTHGITAQYNGSTSFIGSSASLIQNVN